MPAEYLRQLAFLVPTIAIPLFLVLLAYLPYINQWFYLSHMKYDFYEFINADDAAEDDFLYTKSMSFAEKAKMARLRFVVLHRIFSTLQIPWISSALPLQMMW